MIFIEFFGILTENRNMIEVIYKTKDFLALNKPAGMLVHPVFHKGGKERTQDVSPVVTDWLLKHFPEVKSVGDNPEGRPGIVHRLDKDTSGVLIVPRNQKFFHYIKGLFQTHKMQKTYLALVRGRVLQKGIVNAPIGLRPGTTKRSVRGKNLKMVKEAITEYVPIRVYESATLLRVTPRTGRTHQIRIHLASIGHPIVGDELYGKQKSEGLSRQFLHAESIEFTTKKGERIKIEAPLPLDLKKVLAELG